MNQRRFSHHLIKVLGYCSMKIGQLVFFLKKKKIYKIQEIEQIVINRSDRIGDATLTRPLIDILVHYLRENGYTGSFIIMASEINKVVFSDFDGTIEVIDERIKIESSNIREIARYKVYQGITCIYMKIKSIKQKEKTLFIDFVGWWDMSILMKYYSLGYTSMVSCNLCFGSVLLTNRIDTPFTTFQNKRNLIETYIDLIENTFDQKGKLRTYVYDHIHAFYSEYLTAVSHGKSGILIFVGCKADRNFSITSWINIINHFAKNFAGNITVIDDNLNIYYKQLAQTIFPNNVQLIENKHPLEEFKSFATSFQRILGLDGGGMNYIRSVANNITIYTLADCNVRSAFVGNESYKIKELSNGWFTGTATIAIGPQKLRNIYVAKESFGFFEDIDIAQVYNAIFCENTYTIL